MILKENFCFDSKKIILHCKFKKFNILSTLHSLDYFLWSSIYQTWKLVFKNLGNILLYSHCTKWNFFKIHLISNLIFSVPDSSWAWSNVYISWKSFILISKEIRKSIIFMAAIFVAWSYIHLENFGENMDFTREWGIFFNLVELFKI